MYVDDASQEVILYCQPTWCEKDSPVILRLVSTLQDVYSMKTKVSQYTVNSTKLQSFTEEQGNSKSRPENICIVIAISKDNPRCLPINLVDTSWMMLPDLLIGQKLAEWWFIVSMRIVPQDGCSWSDNFTCYIELYWWLWPSLTTLI